MQASSNIFRDRIISSGIWQACSTKFNPCGFLWDCLNDKVYNSNPHNEKLEENIHREIGNIPAEQLQKVTRNHFC
jgi:hypothetical protein